MKRLIGLTLLLLFAAGCASVNQIDRSLVNSRMMDISAMEGLRSLPPHSGLKSFTDGAGGTGCSVCAH